MVGDRRASGAPLTASGGRQSSWGRDSGHAHANAGSDHEAAGVGASERQ